MYQLKVIAKLKKTTIHCKFSLSATNQLVLDPFIVKDERRKSFGKKSAHLDELWKCRILVTVQSHNMNSQLPILLYIHLEELMYFYVTYFTNL